MILVILYTLYYYDTRAARRQQIQFRALLTAATNRKQAQTQLVRLRDVPENTTKFSLSFTGDDLHSDQRGESETWTASLSKHVIFPSFVRIHLTLCYVFHPICSIIPKA